MKAAFGGEAPPFYEQFPQSRGIVILSAPVYSEDETAAVVFVHRVDRIDDPPGIIVVLQRSGAAWQAVGSLNTTSESSSTR
jgi:hypothetical protein